MIKTQLIGRLGADAEVKSLQNGNRIMVLNIAVDLSYRNKDGEKVEKTQWVRATQWNVKENATIQNYLKKGGEVFIEGEPSANAYAGKDGAPAASLEIKISMIKLVGGKAVATTETTTEQKATPTSQASNVPDDDDSVPF